MNGGRVKAAVREYRRQYSIRTVSWSSVRDSLEKTGYTLVPFLPAGNTAAVDTVIRTLGLQNAVRTAKAFTYADADYRLVFVRRDLTEDEKLLLLAHEIGHIFLGHMSQTCILGRDVTEEYEANEFSHYLLHTGPVARFKASFLAHRKRNLAILAAVLLLAVGAATARAVWVRKTYYGNYYVTETGTKYHKRSCVVLKKSETVRRMTVTEYESGLYEPCQVCLPEE